MQKKSAEWELILNFRHWTVSKWKQWGNESGDLKFEDICKKLAFHRRPLTHLRAKFKNVEEMNYAKHASNWEMWRAFIIEVEIRIDFGHQVKQFGNDARRLSSKKPIILHRNVTAYLRDKQKDWKGLVGSWQTSNALPHSRNALPSSWMIHPSEINYCPKNGRRKYVVGGKHKRIHK